MNTPLDVGHPADEYRAYSFPASCTRSEPSAASSPSVHELTDGAGLVLLRGLWNELGLGAWIAARAAEVGGWFRSLLMVEVWTALSWYGGGWMDDLRLLARRRVRRLFGWEQVPDPTTFGHSLRRAGGVLVPQRDRLLWRFVR